MKNESNVKMPFVLNELGTILISWNEQEKVTDNDTKVYVYDSLRVKKSCSYEQVVSALINEGYSKRESIRVARKAFNIEDDIDYIKSEVLADIKDYDKSENVNSFYLGEKLVPWNDSDDSTPNKNMRIGVRNGVP